MIQFICDHPGVILQILGILGTLLGMLVASVTWLVVWVFKRELTHIRDMLISHGELLREMSANYLSCQKELPKMYVGRHEFEEFLIQRKADWDQFTHQLTQLLVEFKSHKHDNGVVVSAYSNSK
jgi:hypothetical protein